MFLKPATGPVGIILYSHLDLSQPIKLGPQLLKSIQMLNSGIMQMLSKKQTWAFTAAILFFSVSFIFLRKDVRNLENKCERGEKKDKEIFWFFRAWFPPILFEIGHSFGNLNYYSRLNRENT